MDTKKIQVIRLKLCSALGTDGILLGDNEVAALILLCDLHDDLDTAIQDFKCARTVHHNATPDEKSDAKTVYNDIIGRLEAIFDSPKESK